MLRVSRARLRLDEAEGRDRPLELGAVGREGHEDLDAALTVGRHRREVRGQQALADDLERRVARAHDARGRGEGQVEEEQELPSRRRLEERPRPRSRRGVGGGVDLEKCHERHLLALVLQFEVSRGQPAQGAAGLVGHEHGHRHHLYLGAEDGRLGDRRLAGRRRSQCDRQERRRQSVATRCHSSLPRSASWRRSGSNGLGRRRFRSGGCRRRSSR